MPSATPPRYAADRTLPPYAFIPGKNPHPLTDPDGHSYGLTHAPASALSPDEWRDNGDYLWGVDLFNHGFPWEAHESWEGVWRVCERGSDEHAFLQGLIQCAAALVKARGRQSSGVTKLAAGGLRYLNTVQERRGDGFCGVALGEFREAFSRWVEGRSRLFRRPRPPLIVLSM